MAKSILVFPDRRHALADQVNAMIDRLANQDQAQSFQREYGELRADFDLQRIALGRAYNGRLIDLWERLKKAKELGPHESAQRNTQARGLDLVQ